MSAERGPISLCYSGVVARTTIILNAGHGPWMGGEFGKQKSEAMVAFMNSIDTNSEFWAENLEWLAFDQGLTPFTEPDLLWESIWDMKSFQRKGVYVLNHDYSRWLPVC